MHRILTFALLAPVLMAQAPANPAGQTLAQKLAEETKAIEVLSHEKPVEALAKAKALLPTTKPVFDKTNLQTAYTSIWAWNDLIDLHLLVYKTGVAAGHFEEAREAAVKARDLAKELQTAAMESFSAHKAIWVKAGEESSKLLDEIKQLEAQEEANRVAKAVKPAPGPKMSIEDANAEIMLQAQVAQQQARNAQRLAFLKANEATYKENVEYASKVMVPLERPIKDLEFRTHAYDGPIEQWDKYLKNEAEDLSSKYKGDKAKYAAGLLRGVAPKPDNKEAALVSLHRAAYLDPKNAAIQKRISQLMGKADAPAAKHGKVKKR